MFAPSITPIKQFTMFVLAPFAIFTLSYGSLLVNGLVAERPIVDEKRSSPSSSATSLSSSGNKWGLAWPNGNASYLDNFALPDVSYLYTWTPYLPEGLADLGITGIPMLWGSDQVSEFQEVVVKGYASYVFGMNEPNEASQSNLSPAEGAALWMQYIDPLYDQGYYLISPACTNADNGIQWMQEFFQACSGCHVDAVAFHYYSTNATDFITYATELYDEFNLPVWATEFADENLNGGTQPSESDVTSFATAIAQFIDETDWMQGAFPFGLTAGGTGNNQLIDSNDEPTALANIYFGTS